MIHKIFKNIYQWFFTRDVKKNGIYSPIIVNKDGFILDGNHRVKAAIKLGIKIPAIVLQNEIVEIDPKTLIIR